MIGIVTPCGDSIKTMTHHDLMALAVTIQTPAFISEARGGANLSDRLNEAAKDCLSKSFTHMAIIEADMRFKSNAIDLLMADRRDIVGANYMQREQDEWTATGMDGKFLSSRGKTGCERVMQLGCGVILIDLRVFRAVPQPWFSSPWIPELGHHAGIDFFFCRNAEQHGFWSWVNHGVSQDVRHAADVEKHANGNLIYPVTGLVVGGTRQPREARYSALEL